MSEDISLNYEDLWYIKTRSETDKRPKEAWGGYEQDFDAAASVYSHDDVVESDETSWAINGIQDPDRMDFSLLIFDLDIHEAPDDFDPDTINVQEDTPIVRSQSGGFHVYFAVHRKRGSGAESDFTMTEDLGWDIDIRGSFVSHHVRAPADIPGVEGPYELVKDDRIKTVFDPADAAERITYKGEPLLEYDPDTGISSSTDVEIDRDADPPEDLPTCYHRGLQVRAASPDDHPNTHKVNVLTALCGLYAGYSVEEMVDHFVEEYPPDTPDREKTRYQLNHIAEKIDRGDYAPPALSTLRDYAILAEHETCNCRIEFHGSSVAGSLMDDEEMWEWWAEKRASGDLSADSIIPTPALWHVAREHTGYNFDALEDDEDLPTKAHNRALYWVNSTWPEDVGLDEDEDATARNYQARDPEVVRTWEDVRYVYEEHKGDGRLAAVNLLRERYHFLTPTDTETLHIYDEELGFYDRTAMHVIGRELDRNLGSHYSTHEKREIVSRLEEEKYDRSELEARQLDGHYVCVKNGVLDLDNRELLAHDPKYRFTTFLPVEYDPSVDCHRVRQFLDEITAREEDSQTLLEMLGHTLLPNYDYAKVLMLFGEGRNGKSTWLNVVRTFLNGPEGETRNVENIDLQKLTENRFAASNLVDKWANVAEDLPQRKIADLGAFKDLTGGGEVWAESKGEDGFNFENRATMMFAANRPPILAERSTAVKRRLVPVHLPYEFVEEPDPEDPDQKQKQTEGLDEELTTERQLSGLLNAALDGLERLRESGDVSLPENLEERLEIYERHSDHIKAFRVDVLTNERGQQVSKEAVYNAYTNYCNENDYAQVTRSTFWEQIRQTTLNVSEKRLPEQPDGNRPRVLQDATFTEGGARYAPEGAEAGTGDETDEGTDETETDVTRLADIEPGRRETLEVEVVAQVEPKPWLQAEGEFVDESGTIVDYVARGQQNDNPAIDLEEGGRYRLENAKVETDEDGALQVRITGAVDITRLDEDPQQTHVDPQDSEGAEATPDGGSAAAAEDTQGERLNRARTILRNQGPEMKQDKLIAEMIDYDPDAVRKRTVPKLRKQGAVEVREDENGDTVLEYLE